MNTSRRRRVAALVGAAALLASLTTTAPAFARPEPQPTAPAIDRSGCALERIGTQFVKCDNLTGAGAPAPAWVREQ